MFNGETAALFEMFPGIYLEGLGGKCRRTFQNNRCLG